MFASKYATIDSIDAQASKYATIDSIDAQASAQVIL